MLASLGKIPALCHIFLAWPQHMATYCCLHDHVLKVACRWHHPLVFAAYLPGGAEQRKQTALCVCARTCNAYILATAPSSSNLAKLPLRRGGGGRGGGRAFAGTRLARMGSRHAMPMTARCIRSGLPELSPPMDPAAAAPAQHNLDNASSLSPSLRSTRFKTCIRPNRINILQRNTICKWFALPSELAGREPFSRSGDLCKLRTLGIERQVT